MRCSLLLRIIPATRCVFLRCLRGCCSCCDSMSLAFPGLAAHFASAFRVCAGVLCGPIRCGSLLSHPFRVLLAGCCFILFDGFCRAVAAFSPAPLVLLRHPSLIRARAAAIFLSRFCSLLLRHPLASSPSPLALFFYSFGWRFSSSPSPLAGPYKVNGVPLRRLNQSYVIATSTQVDVSKVDVSKIDDAFFVRKDAKKAASKDGEGFFAKDAAKPAVNPARKAETARVDAALSAIVKATPELRHYLAAKFTLTRGQKPHLLKF